MYLNVVACEVLVREICHLVAGSPHICDVTFLTQGYHDTVVAGRTHLQSLIDDPESSRYDAILLGYGLCNNLIAGLEARDVPLVVPKAHDCITLFLGSRERYDREFRSCPGTYWYTSGWLEARTRRGGIDIEQSGLTLSAQYEELVRRYGEDNAAFLVEALAAWTKNYERGALIRFDFDRVLDLDRRVRETCAERGWRYEELAGDLGLLRRWLAGEWSPHEFLVVPPGQRLLASWDGQVLKAAPPE